MILDLKNIFCEFNKITKSNTFLYDPGFSIAISNPQKIFDIFYAKFTLAITSLKFIN